MRVENGVLLANNFKNLDKSDQKTSEAVVKSYICTTQAENISFAPANVFNSNKSPNKRTKNTANTENYYKGVKIAKIDANYHTSINKLTIIASNKAKLADANNDLIIKILDKTLIRSFDISDSGNKNELANTAETHKNSTQLKINLQTINKWLQKTQNKDEVVFLSCDENQSMPLNIADLYKIFGKNAVLTPSNFDKHFPSKNNDSNALTLKELTNKGIRVVIAYKNDQKATLKVSNSHEINLIYEDDLALLDPQYYTIKQYIDIYSIPDAKKLNLSSLDNYPDSLLLRFGATFATVALALTGFLSVFQIYSNEVKIKKQDKIIPKELSKVDLPGILLARQQAKKNVTIDEITKSITISEVKASYKNKQLSAMNKKTFLFGGSAIIGILSALLSLSVLLPALLPAIFGVAGILLVISFTILAIAMKYNRKRLNNSIDKSFATDSIKEVLQKHVDVLNHKLEKIIQLSKHKDNQDPKTYIKNIIKLENITNELTKVETTARHAMVISNIGLLKTLIIPSVIVALCSGTSIILGFILVVLNGTLNYINRRKNLDNISQFVTEKTACDYNKKQKRKLMLFGYTALERFIYQDKERLIKVLNLPEEAKFKDVFAKLTQLEHKAEFKKYLINFTICELNKELKSLASKQNPKLDFKEIIQDRKQLRQLLRKHVIKKITKSVSRDTLISGILSSIILITLSVFLSIFFPPLIIVVIGLCIALLGVIVSKIVAINEANIFKKRIITLLDTDSQNLNPVDLAHKQKIENLIFSREEEIHKK